VTKYGFAWLASILLLCPQNSYAQSEPSPPPSPASLEASLGGAAKDAYDAGRLLFANHDFSGALAKFRQAFALEADPRLLFDMAVCERNLHRYAHTQALLERYLSEGDGRASEDSRRAARHALEALAQLVGWARIRADPSGSTVELDGERIGVAPLPPLMLDAGMHTLVVEKAGFVRAERRFEVTGPGETEIALSLLPVSRGATLVISGEPGATISIDGRMLVQERFDQTLAAGPHEVLVTARGRRSYRAKLELREGETHIENVTLEVEHPAPVWPWIAAGGALLAVGIGVGTYVLWKPTGAGSQLPPVDQGYVQFRTWRTP
jgi:hypothetical protein